MRIAFTMAGRQEMMGLLVKYMTKALEKNILDEWHVWDLSRTDSDSLWLKRSISHPKIKLMDTPFKEKNESIIGHSSFNQYNGFKHVYQYYNNAIWIQHTFVKTDDDIVYIDLDKFDRFFKTIECNLNNKDFISANVINSEVPTYYQRQLGLLKNLPYQDNLNQNEIEVYAKIFHGIHEDNVDPQLFKFPSELILKVEQLHTYFISNLDLIKLTTPEITVKIHNQTRICINFIGFKGSFISQLIKAFHQFPEHWDDEYIMNFIMPKHFETNKFMAVDFYVTHLAFAKQRKHGVDWRKIYNWWESKLCG